MFFSHIDYKALLIWLAHVGFQVAAAGDVAVGCALRLWYMILQHRSCLLVGKCLASSQAYQAGLGQCAGWGRLHMPEAEHTVHAAPLDGHSHPCTGLVCWSKTSNTVAVGHAVPSASASQHASSS